MYAQAAIKSNILLRNGAYGIVMRGVHFCTCAGASLRSRNSVPLCCIIYMTVYDIGFGTGTLTTKLYEHGCSIYGQDFSSRMIELASGKMPGSHLYQGDFTKGLVEPLRNQCYDFIVATYSLHHLTDEQKISFLRTLCNYLKENGKILIGDVAFTNRDELNQCRQEAGDEWDEEEVYFVADELRSAFPGIAFRQISYCAGILTLTR